LKYENGKISVGFHQVSMPFIDFMACATKQVDNFMRFTYEWGISSLC